MNKSKPRNMSGLLAILWLLVGVLISQATFAADEEFLPADEAFKLTFTESDGQLRAHWDIADGYYLYESRMSFKTDNERISIGEPNFPLEAEEKQDPYFGMQRVYHHAAEMNASYSISGDDNGKPLVVKVGYQGCAEAGLCYPPQTRKLELNGIVSAGASDSNVNQQAQVAQEKASVDSTVAEEPSSQNQSSQSESSQLAAFLSGSSLWVVAGTFFLLGLGLTFTPCVLPMVPILSSIIAGQKGEMTPVRGFALSMAYVLGMAFTYTLLGVLVGFFGAKANIQAWMQQPWVLGVFSALFVLLALSMFGFYEIQLPSRLRDKLDDVSRRQKGGQLFGVTLMGIVSALVVSPCVSAPLAGALLYISSTGDALMGGIALFALSMGMGAPLVAIGSTGAKLLPKAGVWMDKVKQVFGIILLGVALWLMQRVLPEFIALLLWSLLLVTFGLHLGAFRQSDNGWHRIGQGLGILSLLWGVFVLISLAMERGSIEAPLHGLVEGSGSGYVAQSQEAALFERITTRQALDTALSSNQPVVLDFYADWCISCIEMEKNIFSKPSVRGLSGEFKFVQLDVTDFSAEHKAILDKFGLVGPPAVLFFDATGQEVKSVRIAGDTTLDGFMKAVQGYRNQAK